MRLLSTTNDGDELSDRTRRIRALIVEDDADSREAMGTALRRLGHDTDCAGTLLEGAAKLSPRVRWLILDLRLPDGDGAGLLRHIREHDLPINVAVVTGSRDGVQLTDAVLLKPDAFFTKPVDFGDVARWMTTADHYAGDA
jgi:DNA-binding NtrC family response regulator